MSRHVTLAIFLASMAMSASAGATQIVDVNADVNDLRNPVRIFLEAGTYSVTPIGSAGGGAYEAWSPWFRTTCTRPEGCAQTAPTTVTGWQNTYNVIAASIVAVSIAGDSLERVDSEPTGVDSFSDFFLVNDTERRYRVHDGMVYRDTASALAAARSSTFTLSESAEVGFAIADIRPLADNRGGVSLLVTAVPEPSTAALFGLGLLGLAGAGRRPSSDERGRCAAGLRRADRGPTTRRRKSSSSESTEDSFHSRPSCGAGE